MTKFIEQRVDELENQVAKLELIIHELRGKKSIEPSTTNTVEDIIEFEGQQYRKVDRLAREGDVVVFDSKIYPHNAEPNKPYIVNRETSFGVGHHDGETICDVKFAIYDHGRTPENVDVYELMKEGLNPQIPMIDETIEPLTPNQQRAEVIEKAKKLVEEKGKGFDFSINENKRIIAFNIRTEKAAFAKCNPSDVFNEHIGKAIALGRALGLNVSEFEQAVQPTVAVGQLLGSSYTPTYPTRWKVDDLNNTGKNLTIIDSESKSLNGKTADGGYLPNETWYKIVDDTNAKYEVES